MPPVPAAAPAIVLFDGECGFCARTVQFIVRHDPRAHFRFATLQSAAGQVLLAQHGLPVNRLDSVVLLENGRIFTRSTAALRICRRLSGAWPLLAVGFALPLSWRDQGYDWIARRRRRLAGPHAISPPLDASRLIG